MTMMEDQTAKGYDPKSLGREADPVNFDSKEICKSNDSKMDTSAVAFGAKDKDECWKHKVMDDFSMDNENGTNVSSIKEDQNGLSDELTGWRKDLDSLSKDKEQIGPEHEILVEAEEFTNESKGTTSPCNSASDLSEKDTNLFSDKNVLKCEIELPELEVCYKEINDHVVKDICIDEGRSGKDKNFIQHCKDDKSDHLVPQPCDDNDHLKATEISLLEIAYSLGANQCGSKVEKDGKLIGQERLKSPSDSSLDKDSTKHCDPEDYSGTEAGEPEQDVQTSSSLLYNSNVESGTITFDFNSPSPVGDTQDHQNANADDNLSNSNTNLHDQTPQHKDGYSDGFSTDGQNQHLSGCDAQAVDPKHERRNSGNASVVSQLQYDEGETSFSAASLITYSGPMVNSGSISHRSDGSAASTRSFAFPVLQNEWNSSPVRMAKADRRQFRKNKCWRSGLLCCGF